MRVDFIGASNGQNHERMRIQIRQRNAQRHRLLVGFLRRGYSDDALQLPLPQKLADMFHGLLRRRPSPRTMPDSTYSVALYAAISSIRLG